MLPSHFSTPVASLRTYIAIDPIHLFRYVDERVFTFNNRKENDFGRFNLALVGIANRRLT